jgi:flagellar biosynthesis protein FlhF
MRLKSYFADTIEAAMTLAARELGEDALLVYSREAAAEAKYLGAHEVVFAAPENESRPGANLPPQETAAVPALGLPAHPMPNEQLGWASAALAELKSEIGGLRADVASHRRCVEDLLTSSDRRAWRLLADWGSEPELLPGVALAGHLLQADMDAEHVLEMIECTRDALRVSIGMEDGGLGPDMWKRFLERELTGRRHCDPRLGQPGKSAAIVLIGPPGSGKTTVAMQLTAYACGKGMDPRLIAFEPGRLTAAQTLRSYAAVLGAPFEFVRRADNLATLLAGRDPGTLTIVDGPGLGAAADDGSLQLGSFIGQQPAAETWLVLPASLRTSDLRLLIDRFSTYGPKRLIFTRTGETRHWGAVWSAAEWAGLPVGFFCDGPRIPEDLRAASAEAIVRPLLAGESLGPRQGRPRTGRPMISGRG